MILITLQQESSRKRERSEDDARETRFVIQRIAARSVRKETERKMRMRTGRKGGVLRKRRI